MARHFHLSILMILCIYGFALTRALGAEVHCVTFGDISYRRTNIYKENYNLLTGWVENRVLLQDLLKLGPEVQMNPYFKTTVTLSSRAEIPEENTFVYGAGVELRASPNSGVSRLGIWLNWLGHVRLYGEYLRVRFLRREVGDWVPREDWRYGVELWREFNVDLTAQNMNPTSLRDLAWGEIWTDVNWKKSNFFLKDYKGWAGAAVYRFGLRFPKIDQERDIFLMPYLVNEISAAQWCFFWQNRSLVGLGMRLMPFQHAESNWLRRLRIYVEHLWVTGYSGDRPISGTPDTELKVGINFSNDWWR